MAIHPEHKYFNVCIVASGLGNEIYLVQGITQAYSELWPTRHKRFFVSVCVFFF